MKKTNATRLLDKLNIDYQIIAYKVDPNDLSAEHVSKDTGIPLKQIFKTLLVNGDKSGEMITCIPGDAELDLKKIAQITGNKKIHLVPVKDINKKTGYIRGGVSPLGLKYTYSQYIDKSSLQHDFILVSAGLRGLQIKIRPQDLISACNMNIESLVSCPGY